MAAIGPVAAVSLSDAEDMLALAEREGITLTIVGPELPLSVGVVDRFVEAGRPILGPSRAAARIETSKVWAKQFMARHRVPTARFLDRRIGRSRLRGAQQRATWLAAGDQGRRACRRQGRRPGQPARGSDGGHRRDAHRQQVWRGRSTHRARRVSRRTRGVVLRSQRRPPGDGDWHRAGSQTRPRRRSRPEHRWDGRLCAKPPDDARARGASAAGDSASRPGGHARRGAPVSRLPVLRPDADGARPDGDRVQRQARRSGSAGDPAAHRRAAAAVCSTRRRPARCRIDPRA